jgi:hypothetical protein
MNRGTRFFKTGKWREGIIFLLVAVTFGGSLFWLGRWTGFASPFFWTMLTFALLGLAGFARPVVMLRMPPVFREVRQWEIDGAFSQTIGVPAFGRLLLDTPLRRLNSQVYLRRPTENPNAVLHQIEAAEVTHVLAMSVAAFYAVYAVFHRWWGPVLWFVFFNLVVNLYPALHLRSARGRLKRIIERNERSCRRWSENISSRSP